jgi:hypothetical protein
MLRQPERQAAMPGPSRGSVDLVLPHRLEAAGCIQRGRIRAGSVGGDAHGVEPSARFARWTSASTIAFPRP